jgi:hypothetical protein
VVDSNVSRKLLPAVVALMLLVLGSIDDVVAQGRALPQEPKCSFTPGFSPVMNGNKRRGTVLTVCSSGQSTEAVEHEEVTSTAGRRNR